MISKKEKVVNSILGTVYVSSSDPSVVRINFDALIRSLEEYGYILPRAIFEDKLESILNAKLPEGTPTDNSGRWIIAVAIYNVAEQMTTTKEALRAYYIKNRMPSEQLIKDVISSEQQFGLDKILNSKDEHSV